MATVYTVEVGRLDKVQFPRSKRHQHVPYAYDDDQHMEMCRKCDTFVFMGDDTHKQPWGLCMVHEADSKSEEESQFIGIRFVYTAGDDDVDYGFKCADPLKVSDGGFISTTYRSAAICLTSDLVKRSESPERNNLKKIVLYQPATLDTAFHLLLGVTRHATIVHNNPMSYDTIPSEVWLVLSPFDCNAFKNLISPQLRQGREIGQNKHTRFFGRMALTMVTDLMVSTVEVGTLNIIADIRALLRAATDTRMQVFEDYTGSKSDDNHASALQRVHLYGVLNIHKLIFQLNCALNIDANEHRDDPLSHRLQGIDFVFHTKVGTYLNPTIHDKVVLKTGIPGIRSLCTTGPALSRDLKIGSPL
jgi:hypothetical protein